MDPLRVVRVHSLAELRGISPDDARGLEVILWPSKKRYIFNPSSSAADDGDLVIKPADGVDGCCQGGRWEKEYDPLVPLFGEGLRTLEAEEVSGTSGAGGGYSNLGTATLTFTLDEERDVLVLGQATAALDFLFRTDALLGVNIDGTDYNGTYSSSSTLGNREISPCVVHKSKTLGIGSHTITLRGVGGVGFISSAGQPSRLTVVY